MSDVELPRETFLVGSDIDDFLNHLREVVVWAGIGPPTGDEPEYLYVSAGFEEIWGRPRDALLDDFEVLMEGVHPADKERVRAVVADPDYGQRNPDTIEHRVVQPDGTVRWVQAHTYLVADESGTPAYVLGITTDITDRKRAERDLEQKTERLEAFAATVSHDLRNPLNIAEGRIELGRAEHDSQHLEIAAQAIDRTHSLIDDLLALARTGDQIDHLERIDLGSAAEDAWEFVDTVDARLVDDVTQDICADRSRLRQLLKKPLSECRRAWRVKRDRYCWRHRGGVLCGR